MVWMILNNLDMEKGQLPLVIRSAFTFMRPHQIKMDKMDDLGGKCLKFAQKWMKSMKMD